MLPANDHERRAKETSSRTFAPPSHSSTLKRSSPGVLETVPGGDGSQSEAGFEGLCYVRPEGHTRRSSSSSPGTHIAASGAPETPDAQVAGRAPLSRNASRSHPEDPHQASSRPRDRPLIGAPGTELLTREHRELSPNPPRLAAERPLSRAASESLDTCPSHRWTRPQRRMRETFSSSTATEEEP